MLYLEAAKQPRARLPCWCMSPQAHTYFQTKQFPNPHTPQHILPIFNFPILAVQPYIPSLLPLLGTSIDLTDDLTDDPRPKTREFVLSCACGGLNKCWEHIVVIILHWLSMSRGSSPGVVLATLANFPTCSTTMSIGHFPSSNVQNNSTPTKHMFYTPTQSPIQFHLIFRYVSHFYPSPRKLLAICS